MIFMYLALGIIPRACVQGCYQIYICINITSKCECDNGESGSDFLHD